MIPSSKAHLLEDWLSDRLSGQLEERGLQSIQHVLPAVISKWQPWSGEALDRSSTIRRWHLQRGGKKQIVGIALIIQHGKKDS